MGIKSFPTADSYASFRKKDTYQKVRKKDEQLWHRKIR